MEIGKLNRLIRIEKRIATPDPRGGEVVTWQLVVNAWANVRSLNGIETLKSDAIASTAKYSMRIRRREDVDATCRVVFKAQNFNILAVLPDEQGREFIDLACETGGNDG